MPQELHDLAHTSDPRAFTWRDHMVETLRGRPEGFVSNETLVPSRPVSPILAGSLAAESARAVSAT